MKKKEKATAKLENCKIVDVGNSKAVIIPASFFRGTFDADRPVSATIEQDPKK